MISLKFFVNLILLINFGASTPQTNNLNSLYKISKLNENELEKKIFEDSISNLKIKFQKESTFFRFFLEVFYLMPL